MAGKMNAKSQRDAFLNGEGDQSFLRNKTQDNIDKGSESYFDPLIPYLLDLPLKDGPDVNVLEIGCGQALRLKKLSLTKGWTVHGVDPSLKAVEYSKFEGINSKVSTADNLPYEDNKFDLLIYGFCLYVCDRDDLFKIASEANRVLKDESWLAIFDFWMPYPEERNYHHLKGIKSYKMDLPNMFNWHPAYVMINHTLRHHKTSKFTDDKNEWVASTLLRKKMIK
tara:strand:- start:2765 stop:3436 length:672 start_codon:yes stop_codon:yes gene_type:complete